MGVDPVLDAYRIAEMSDKSDRLEHEAEDYDRQLLEELTKLCDALGVDTNIFDVDDNRSSPLYIVGYLTEAVKSAFETSGARILHDQEADTPDSYNLVLPLTERWKEPFPQVKKLGDMIIRNLTVSGGKFEMSGEFSEPNVEGIFVQS